MATPPTPGWTLDPDTAEFISPQGVRPGVTAKQARGRWRYHSASGRLLASGMTPDQFVKEFWFGEFKETDQ